MNDTNHQTQQCVFILAGEASGDLYGGMLVKALLRSNPELKALDDASRARLRAYLKQHDRLSHLATQQRLVSYPNAGTSDQ